MRLDYVLRNGRLVESLPGTGNVVVYLNPPPDEKQTIIESLDIDQHTLDSALDPEEISRIEYEAPRNHAFVIWKIPNRASFASQQMFETSSLGISIQPDCLTLVVADQESPFEDIRLGMVSTLNELALRLMLGTINHYLGHLRAIKMMSREIQAKLNTSLENRYLLRMFDLSESLVYYVDSIEANGAVLTKLRSLSRRIGFSEEEVELLDDVSIENAQCSRQGHIYTTVLAGMLDARGNIVNNNMNVLLKNLTIINVVFLPLGVIASMGGMSEFQLFLDHHGIDGWLGYLGFVALMFVLGVWFWKLINQWTRRITGEGMNVSKQRVRLVSKARRNLAVRRQRRKLATAHD